VVIGVDSGTTNCGLAAVDADTRELLWQSTHFICRRAHYDDVAVAQDIVDVVRHLMERFGPSGILQVVAETQWMSAQLRSVQVGFTTAVVSLLSSRHISLVSAATVKVHFVKEGLGFNGHYQNKRDALALCRRWHYPVDSDHTADAVLLALYWLDINGL